MTDPRAPRPGSFDPRSCASDSDWLRALELFDAGDVFEAHERFEARWRATSEPAARSLLRALVQLCALELAVRGAGTRRAIARG